MAGITPIPTTRVSGLLMRQRLTQQFQSDQLALFRLQEQISTGQRIVLPSDDAPAALRSISLQRLLERKEQLGKNIQTGEQFLSATDAALTQVATELGEIRGSTLGVADTISSDRERQSAIAQVNRLLEQMVTLGNQKFRGRYLFAGSQTSDKPYSQDGNNVTYHGDNRHLQSHSNFGVLFPTNAPGQQVFGGTSAQVTGAVDLNPQLNFETTLSSLRGGRGLSPNGALAISDGSSTSIVDISSAKTIGDVVRLIQENPPTGRRLQVDVTGTGINLKLLNSGGSGGNLTVNEVGNGSVAEELGILEPVGVQTNTLVGSDLNPVLLKTTHLDDLLGTTARTTIKSGAAKDNNDILLEANSNGSELNGVTVQFVDDELLAASQGLAAGDEVAEYDPAARPARAALTFSGGGNDLILTATAAGVEYNDVVISIADGGAIGDAAVVNYDDSGPTKTLTIAVDSTGATSIQTVIDEIAAEGTFVASHDDSVEPALNPAASVNAADVGVVQGNTGSSGGEAKTLYVRIAPNATTANQVVSAINAEGTFRASNDPADATSSLEAGTGMVSMNAQAELTAGGSGTNLDQTSGLRIVNGGETHVISLEDAETVEDLLNKLNSPAIGLDAQLNDSRTGIDIHSRLSGNDFQIGENGGQTATQLGVRTYSEQTKLSEFNYGNGVETQDGFQLPTTTGTDITITSSDGQVFDVDLSGAESPSDVVDAVNAVTGGNVTAQLAGAGNQVELVDNTFPGGGELTVSQASGSLAAQYLGLVPKDATVGSTSTDTLTGSDHQYMDFHITTADGQTFGIDLSAAQTVGDVIDRINTTSGGALTAQLSAVGNGIEISDNTTGAGQLTIEQTEASRAGEHFGFIPKGETVVSSSTGVLESEDHNFLENESVFNTLIRLRNGLEAQDLNAVERALESIDTDIDRVTFARAEIGANLQGLELSERNLEDEVVQLKSALSEEIDVDIVEASSELTSRQISMQASLQASGNILQLSLLDFI